MLRIQFPFKEKNGTKTIALWPARSNWAQLLWIGRCKFEAFSHLLQIECRLQAFWGFVQISYSGMSQEGASSLQPSSLKQNKKTFSSIRSISPCNLYICMVHKWWYSSSALKLQQGNARGKGIYKSSYLNMHNITLGFRKLQTPNIHLEFVGKQLPEVRHKELSLNTCWQSLDYYTKYSNILVFVLFSTPYGESNHSRSKLSKLIYFQEPFTVLALGGTGVDLWHKEFSGSIQCWPL